MPRLILTRHSIAESFNPKGDFARNLTTQGLAVAEKLGAKLHELGLIADEQICSAAARTRQTCVQMGYDAAEYDQQLYNAPAELILDTLKRAYGETVLLVAHNPGIAEVAQRFWMHHDNPTFTVANFAPATTAVFEVNCPWAELNWAKAIPELAIDPHIF